MNSTPIKTVTICITIETPNTEIGLVLKKNFQIKKHYFRFKVKYLVNELSFMQDTNR